jgi:cytochrome P450
VQDFNPYSRKLHADPYPTYARLLDEAPVCHNARFGFWAISRYDDVLAALKDWRTYSSASGITLASFSGLKPMIILMDPPRQGELRKLLLKAFTPRRVTGLESRIRGIARELIAAFAGRGECEFVRDFAAPYPTTVIAELLGIDRADREQFKEWSDAIMTAQSVPSRWTPTRSRVRTPRSSRTSSASSASAGAAPATTSCRPWLRPRPTASGCPKTSFSASARCC